MIITVERYTRTLLILELELALGSMGAQAGKIFLLDDDKTIIWRVSYAGEADAVLRAHYIPELAEDYPGRAARTGKPTILTHLARDVGFAGDAVVKPGFQ